MFSTTRQVRMAAGPGSILHTGGVAAALTLAILPLHAAISAAQPVPVFEASGYGVVRPWYESGPALGYDRPVQVAPPLADALAPSQVVTIPGWPTLARAERWRISPDGVPSFDGYLPLRAHATSVAWIDVDGDGHSDLVFGESGDTGYGVEIFRMTAAGLATPGRFVDGLDSYHGKITTLFAADVNGDGRTDIGLGHLDLGTGNETGTWLIASAPDSFVEVRSPIEDIQGAWFAQMDLDGDPHADLVSFHRSAQGLSFYHGLGDGTFTHDGSVWHPADGPPLVADLDGDGPLDLVAGRYVYLGVEGGEPELADSLDQTIHSVADLDHDGRSDLVTVGPGTVTVAKGIGGGRFGPFVPTDLGGFAPGSFGPAEFLTVTDWNADGWADLVGIDPPGHTLQAVRGKAPGTFFQPLVLPTGASPVQVALADVLGNDSKLDVVVLARGARRLEVRRGEGDGSFGPSSSFDLPSGARRFALGDLDEDGRLDAAVACDSSRTMAILWGDAAGFGARTDLAVGDSLLEVAMEDLDEDGRLDVLASSSNGSAHAWSGAASRQPPPLPLSVAAGIQGRFLLRDFDEDGHLDLISPGLGSYAQVGYRVETGNGLGVFGTRLDSLGGWTGSYNLPGGGFPNEMASPFAYGRLAGFERPFFVHLAARDSVWALYSWLGGADYGPSGQSGQHPLGRAPEQPYWPGAPPSYELPPSPVQLELVDVTADGLADVVALFRDPALLTVLPGQPGALFGEPVSHIVGLRPSSFALGDVDGDGLPDAVVANEGAGNVLVLRHRAGQVSGVPARAGGGALALRVLGATGGARARFELALASTEPALLECFDTQGRRLASRRIEAPAPGVRVVEMDDSRLPAAGLVFARLRQGALAATARLVRLR